MPKLFGVTLFLSATLLFLVQPMVGKMVLPLLGGTPAVWNTCMVFFQALLLLGYYYSHKSSSKLPTSRQVTVHMAVLMLTVGSLALGAALIENHSPVPIVKSLAPQGSDVPFFGVLLLLTAAIGLPFFTVSTTAPLLQKWFSETGHPSAKDPYFLYAASNFGSLLALVAYPFVVEPNLTLVSQAWMWAVGFVVLIGLVFLCGRAVLNVPPKPAPHPKAKKVPAVTVEAPPGWITKVRWLLLAAVPSSLMLAVTTMVTTDMVSTPLLWIVPLALYLITFIIVFSKLTPAWVHLAATLTSPVLILLVVFTKTVEPFGGINFDNAPKILQHLLHLLPFLAFFTITLTCHGELARTRPSSKHLTDFYLIMSMGGVLGGLFNALFAPLVFTFVSEYPISLVAACLLLPPLSQLTHPDAPRESHRWTWLDLLTPGLFFFFARYMSLYFDTIEKWIVSKVAATIVVFGSPTLVSYFLVERPLRFGMVVAAIWCGTFLTSYYKEREKPEDYQTHYERSFFGTMKISPSRNHIRIDRETIEYSPQFTQLIHGSTVHGMQHKYPDEMSQCQALELLGASTPWDALGLAWIAEPHYRFPKREPLTYYHRHGPVGATFETFWEMNDRDRKRNTDVACIGLGTGSLACYAKPNERMTFFEIDTTVRRLVVDENRFTYVNEATKQGANIDFEMGDARLSLEKMDRKWGLILVDAFSSDSIPAHLLTVESMKLYFDHLSEDGLLALHISNRYMRLDPVVDQIVRELKLEAITMRDSLLQNYEWPERPYRYRIEFSGRYESSWVLIARKKEAFGPLRHDYRWHELPNDPAVGLWTDDYTPVTRALRAETAWDRWLLLFGLDP